MSASISQAAYKTSESTVASSEAASGTNTILRATSDSDAMTATDVFSGIATDGVASSNKASQVSTTS